MASDPRFQVSPSRWVAPVSSASVSSLVAGALLLALALPLVAHDQTPAPAQERPLLLRGGDLYTISGGVLQATDLLVENGLIAAIGPELVPPSGAEVIDLRGKRVYPGLIAAQSTLGLSEIGAVRATNDHTEVGDVTPEVLARMAFNPDSELLPTVRSHGVTTAQITPMGDLVRGRSAILHLDGWTQEDAAVEKADGLQIRWPSAQGRRFGPPVPLAERERQAREKVALLKQSFDDARAYHQARLAEPELPVDVRWEAMRPVFEGYMPTYIAADRYGHIVAAVDFAQEHGLRMVLVGGREAGRAADLLRERDIAVVLGPTQALPLRQDDAYDAPFRLPATLHEAGVRFCLSQASRSPFGASWGLRNLPFQAAQAAAFGLPRDVALRAVTLSVAEILGIADRQGSLEVGKRATLFVSSGDVLDTLGQDVSMVLIDGRPVDLDNRHRQLERKYRQRLRAAETP